MRVEAREQLVEKIYKDLIDNVLLEYELIGKVGLKEQIRESIQEYYTKE